MINGLPCNKIRYIGRKNGMNSKYTKNKSKLYEISNNT